MVSFAVHTGCWPLLVVVVGEGLVVSDVDALAREVGQVYARRQRFATLVDTTAVRSMPDAATRTRLADWQNETRDAIVRFNVMTATVIASGVVRGAMTAMNWVFPPPNRQLAVATLAEGYLACVEALRADGLALPPALDRLAKAGGPRSVRGLLDAAA